MLLWEEYKAKHPDGLMYSQFCDRYRTFKKVNKVDMHIEHTAGEEIQVDWAGHSLEFTDSKTGEIKKAYIFVSVLPASAYPFVYAYTDTKMYNWIDAHVRAFEYYNGVPKVTIPDNTKTAVLTPDIFDPVLNKSYHEMARHYFLFISFIEPHFQNSRDDYPAPTGYEEKYQDPWTPPDLYQSKGCWWI